MLAGPECSRCIAEFETVLDTERTSMAHHEEGKAFQIKYKKDVMSFVKTTEELGNPFADGKDLVALHTQEIMENEVVTSLLNLTDRGQELHEQFVSQTIEKPIFPISKTLKRENVLTQPKRQAP